MAAAVGVAERELHQSPVAVEILVVAEAWEPRILAVVELAELQSFEAALAVEDIRSQPLAVSVAVSAEQTKQMKPVAFSAAWTFVDSSSEASAGVAVHLPLE